NVSFCNCGSNPGGLDTLRIASPWFRRRTPVYRLGKKPLDQLAAPPLIPDPVDMTTKAGRSLVSAPIPYVTHDPMLGRPGCEKPVLKKICAGAWLNWSVCTDFTKHTSSTTFPRCGRTSASSAPHWPCLTNLKRGPSAAASERMKA